MLKHLYGVASAGCVAALSVNAYALDPNNSGYDQVTYEYDALGRLISTDRPISGPNSCGELITYNLDPAGNRTSKIDLPVCSGGSGSAVEVSLVGDSTTDEGNTLSFGITRSGDMSVAVSVDYETNNGTATSPSDYTSTSGTISFAEGEASKYIPVNTVDDTNFESDETLLFKLTSVSVGTIATSQVTGTILNEDDPPNTPPVAVNDVVGLNVLQQTTANLIANDSDADGDPLTITSVTQPGNGYVAITGAGTVDIIGWTAGTGAFTYTISDGNGGQATGYVTINVQGGGGFPF